MLVNHYGSDYQLHGINSIADAQRYNELLEKKISDNPALEQSMHKHHETDHGAEFDLFEL